MPHKPVYNAEADCWEWHIQCEYCFEPVYSTGPEGRGVTAAALALTATGAIPFCSPACRAFFDGVSGREIVAVADDVGPDALFELLPDGANGRVAWPEAARELVDYDSG